ncbi:MAG TPA: hypothetical protein DCY13_21840 [Verrucomicrobiales bacterium]|nr:hypothetical protein [Verrucomicrobiales bacterium]
MILVFAGVATVFLAMTLVTLWHLRWVRRLPPLDEPPHGSPPSERPIRCSVVIAARDEEARIEQTLRRLLAQRGVDLEIIVVDDRSKDRTGEILRGLAQEDSRIRVKRVEGLPEGWLGKCHACHVGASAATGDWILFTDADCWLKPDVVARAVRLAERDAIDHVALASGVSSANSGLRASHLLFLMATADWFSGTNRDSGKRHLGFGAFNLVRAAAYRECGGYEALRLTVLDDVKLGLLLKRAGRRTRAFMGGDDVEAHWGTSAFSIVKIMEKNYFAAVEYRTWIVVAGTISMAAFSAVFILGLLSGTTAGLAAALSPLSSILPGVVVARRLRWSAFNALLIPLLIPVFNYALVNSAFVTLRHGGIRWRETFYPIEELRAGGVK